MVGGGGGGDGRAWGGGGDLGDASVLPEVDLWLELAWGVLGEACGGYDCRGAERLLGGGPDGGA